MDYTRRQEAFKSRCQSGPFIHLTNFLSTYYVLGTKDTTRETSLLKGNRLLKGEMMGRDQLDSRARNP